MTNFESITGKIFAAVSSLAFSAVFFAAAIAPANQGVLIPAGLA